jgi:branched-chain amino acid transport system permease protein
MASNIRPAGTFDTSYRDDIALNRTRGDRLLSYGAFLLVLLVPVLTGLRIIPEFWIGTLNNIAIFTIAVQGMNILIGYTGQISLGHAAFMAVGAYSAAIMARTWGFPFWLTIPLGALFTGVVGLIFGLPSLRVKGFYLAMATLAAQFIIPWALQYPLAHITNGANPLPVPVAQLGPIVLNTDVAMFYVIIPVSVLMMLAARNIIRTRTGRAFISIRDNDLAAELLGINVFSYKLQAFFLSALYAGFAGGLFAYDTNSLSLQAFQLDASIEMLAMLVIGGAGFPLGPLFGVAFFNLLNQFIFTVAPFLRATLPGMFPFVQPENIGATVKPTLRGFVLIILLITMPRGLAYYWEIFKISWKIRPYSY